MKIYKINNEKFKSIYMSYNFTIDINDTKYFSYYAVLASLMAKSSQKYATQKEIEKYLNSLYGASFDVNIEKLGDLYNLEFRIEFINKKFLPNNEELLEKILNFLEEMIYNPADWTIDNIDREKQFILERINERKDEKLKYGVQRAEELLCQGEPFGTFLYGEKEVVENIALEDIKTAYSELIKNCVTVIISGNLDEYSDIEEKIESKFASHILNDIKVQELQYNNNTGKEFKYEEVKEYQDTTQSVLSMGLRINDCNEQDFYALNLYNAILGVTPSSKLFQNVREKESLAYTVRSRYYRFKNILVIFAGINKENYEKAVAVIKEQLEDMKNGNITDVEFNSAKDSLLADLLEWNDSKVAMEKMKLSNLIAFKDENITIDMMREKIQNVTLEDVIKVANKVKLEKIFILGGEDNV
ncbi:MAG: insulinase family protein [Clostridia bacterium]|nr:insulinase family protein [Clostridia bacterium]